MIEYQFSIYIIEVFAKKINFKILSHTEYSFLNLGYYPILAIFLKSNSHAKSATDVSQWMENDNLWLPLQDWDHPTHLPHPSDRDVQLTVTVTVAAVKSYLPLPEISKILPVKIR